MNISDRLSELLYHYDCVIVPELGGFVTEYRSAKIDRLLHVIYPPGKDLRFNASLKKNDGLLANAISQAENVSHEEANAFIKKEVESYFSRLEEGLSVSFEKVGILYLDSHKNIQFSPDTSVNYLLESYRLQKIYAKPSQVIQVPLAVKEEVAHELTPVVTVEKEQEEEVKTAPAATAPTPVIALPQERKTKRWLAAALIPLMFYIGYVTVSSDVIKDGTIQMSDLNPFADTTSNSYSERENSIEIDLQENFIPPVTKAPVIEAIETTDELPAPTEVEIETPTPVEEKIIVTTTPAEAVHTYVAPKEVSSMEYHIIGGCFAELPNAEKKVVQLRGQGYKAFIIDKKSGLHRVAYGSYALRSEALEELKKVKTNAQADVWLLRKK